MNTFFPDKIWNYKNFNMATELDIAGEFIYDGIHTFNQMKSIDQKSRLFSFFYYVSVGIERLQKIVIVLSEKVSIDNLKEFEKSLITHSHSDLNSRIVTSTAVKLNPRENEFLQVLTSFYKTARYSRFNCESQYNIEQQLLEDYINKHAKSIKAQNNFITKELLITSDVKEFIGRVIGNIAKKYYNLVYDGSSKNNTYSYEIPSGSKAEKVFLENHRKNSLQDQKITEMVVFKELIIYLMNTKDTNAFLRFIKEIEPLDIDIGLVEEYLSELSQGIVSQALIDEIENQYEEKSFSIERKNMVDLIGNTNVVFGYKDVKECLDLIEKFIKNECTSKEFANLFLEKYELVDEDLSSEGLVEISELCTQYLFNKVSDIYLSQGVKNQYIEIEELYSFLT